MLDGVAVITIDCPNAAVNSLTAELQADLPLLLSIIEGDSAIKACVLRSDKKNNFVAGADINQPAALTSAEDGAKISSEGQMMMNKVENLKKPIVAAINGSAPGGGQNSQWHAITASPVPIRRLSLAFLRCSWAFCQVRVVKRLPKTCWDSESTNDGHDWAKSEG